MTASSASRPVDRWVLEGTLVTHSPLALRTGDPEASGVKPEGSADPAPRDGDAPDVWAIDLDAHGRPFIAGTAIKAALRRILAQALGIEGAGPIRTLLGDASRKEDGRNEAVAWGGRAEVRNAYRAGWTPAATQARGRTAIDDGARVAAEGLLRTQRIVLPGATFAVEIVLDRVGAREAAYLLQALERLPDERIGSGTNAGYGEIGWAEGGAPTLKRMDAAAIVTWLDAAVASVGSVPRPWRDGLGAVDPALAAAHPLPSAPGDAVRIPLHLDFEGFFVVGSGEKPKKAPGETRGAPMRALTARGIVETDPERCVVAPAYLPGTSLKGALRAQSERIWRTLTGTDEAYEPRDAPPKPIARLYGETTRAGLLSVSDFEEKVADGKRPKPAARHEMVAIDRFTGGAAEGLKYAVEAFERPTLAGTLSLRRRRRLPNRLAGVPKDDPPAADAALSDDDRAAIGLLALTLRDLFDGDVPLGWGTRKGYGMVTPDIPRLHAALLALGAALVRWDAGAEVDVPEEAARAALNEAVARLRAEARG